MKHISWMALVLSIALALPAGAMEFSADIISVMPGGKERGKLYFKDSDTSRSEMMGMIIINRRPKVYQLVPDTRKYTVTDIDEIKTENPMAGMDDFEAWVKKNDMKQTGTETVAGYSCQIYTGEVVLAADQPSMPMKVWYSKKLDYPVRNETTFPSPMGKMTTYLENIRDGEQPSRLFEIPDGYTEVDSIQEAMGMGGFQMPGGGESGQPPSREEMERAMKEMQEMQEKMDRMQGQ